MAAGEGVSTSSIETAEVSSWLDHMHDWVTTVDHKKLGNPLHHERPVLFRNWWGRGIADARPARGGRQYTA